MITEIRKITQKVPHFNLQTTLDRFNRGTEPRPAREGPPCMQDRVFFTGRLPRIDELIQDLLSIERFLIFLTVLIHK